MQCENRFFACHLEFLHVRRVYRSISFKSSLIPSGTALFFQNFDRARTGFYLHYLFFTSHGCVSECIFYKIFKGKRWRSQFLKSSFSARTRLSHRPPAVNDSEECVRVYFLSGSSAETVSHAFVDKRESEMREHEFHVHHFLWFMKQNLKSYVSNGDLEVQFGRFRTIFF